MCSAEEGEENELSAGALQQTQWRTQPRVELYNKHAANTSLLFWSLPGQYTFSCGSNTRRNHSGAMHTLCHRVRVTQ
jgi:hypothetical protein